ncbi:MAG: methionyl-tRNA formyltransferase, partial [Raineya sp.]
MRIIFMGTPEFAVPSLQVLVENGYNIVGVVTAPDKPAGRGKQMQVSEVKQYALSQNLPILQPEKLKSPDFLAELQALKADLQVVVAFRMLPEVVWAMPPIGTFNLHASLLPKYRGAAPINWAIINGETETGVTTFFLQHEIDTGNIIFQEKEPISPTDTAGSLYQRLMHKGAKLVLKTVQTIEKGDVQTFPQVGEITHAPKIFRETCQIDWNKTSTEIYNFVRGLAPYPAAWTTL